MVAFLLYNSIGQIVRSKMQSTVVIIAQIISRKFLHRCTLVLVSCPCLAMQKHKEHHRQIVTT